MQVMVQGGVGCRVKGVGCACAVRGATPFSVSGFGIRISSFTFRISKLLHSVPARCPNPYTIHPTPRTGVGCACAVCGATSARLDGGGGVRRRSAVARILHLRQEPSSSGSGVGGWGCTTEHGVQCVMYSV